MNLCISHMYTVQRMIYQKWCIINEDELCLKLHSALQFFTHVMTWHLEYFSAIITMSASKRVFLCPSFQVISIYLLHATLSKMLLKTLYILCTLFTHTVWPQQWLQSVDVRYVLTVYKTKQDWATCTQSQTFTLTHINTLILSNIIHTHTNTHTHTCVHNYTGPIHCLKPLFRCKIHTRMQMCDKTAHGSEWQVGKHCHNFLDDIHRYMQTQHHDCTTQHFHPIPGAMHLEQFPPPPPPLLL